MLNYIKLKELLGQLGMVSETAANDSVERVLLYDFWKALGGEQSEEVPLDDAKIAIMAVMRVTADKRIGVEAEGESGSLGVKDERGRLCLRSEEVLRLQKHFHLFYLNRLQYLGRVIDHSKAQKAMEVNHSYKPTLNVNSKDIASKYRQKVAD
mmetsp:Transcript_46069/g.33844  ORF Transcript_46069/g.33844 Transcript_46069/m.33844 type:complete len:153 (+) Transcript_46069:535-993(+)